MAEGLKLGNPEGGNKPNDEKLTTSGLSKDMLLAGLEKKLDGNTHVSLAIEFNGNQSSTLMIPDLSGTAPVYIDNKIEIDGKKLTAFFKNKYTDIYSKFPDKLQSLIDKTTAECSAFYYQKNGPLLMIFSLGFEGGLLSALLGDGIDEIFDVKSFSLRLFKCPNTMFQDLKDYVDLLKKNAASDTN